MRFERATPNPLNGRDKDAFVFSIACDFRRVFLSF